MGARVCGRNQLARLLQVIGELQSGRCPNARQLAERCEVSRRTIYRDLETLALAGIPVRYRPDRQGYELRPGFAFEAPRLDEREAIALLVLASTWDGIDALGLRREARAAVGKVIQGLPAETKASVQGLAELIGSGVEGSPSEPSRSVVERDILLALSGRTRLRVWHRRPGQATAEATMLDPYRLLCDGGTWWLVGRSSLHRSVRRLRVARIERVDLTDEPATIPPRFRVGQPGPATTAC